MAISMKPDSDDELYAPLAELNVTPFIDVVLVLLVVFMITAPMLAAGMNVDLPKAAAARPLEPKEPIVISVGTEGKLFLGTEEIGRAELIGKVKAKLAGTPVPVHVRGDKAANWGDVVAVLDELAQSGVSALSIVTRTKEPAAP
jgi:biopolymer transport protein TolR